jgi:hypothetical protein
MEKVEVLGLRGSNISHDNGDDGRSFIRRVFGVLRKFLISFLVSKNHEISKDYCTMYFEQFKSQQFVLKHETESLDSNTF